MSSPPPEANAPAPPSLRPTLLTAALLLATLVVLGIVLDFGHSDALLYRTGLPVRSTDAGERAADAEDLSAYIRYTEDFEVSGPTSLEISLARTPARGSLVVACALVDEGSGDVREFVLESHAHETPSGLEGDLAPSALLDRVPSGRYAMRFEAVFRPGVEDEPAPDASVEIHAGRHSGRAFALAAGLILLPPLVQVGRRLAARRRARASNAAETG